MQRKLGLLKSSDGSNSQEMELKVSDKANEETGMSLSVSFADLPSMLGELTDTGRATTLALGERLRKQYVEE